VLRGGTWAAALVAGHPAEIVDAVAVALVSTYVARLPRLMVALEHHGQSGPGLLSPLRDQLPEIAAGEDVDEVGDLALQRGG
jgi:hypothetical protein